MGRDKADLVSYRHCQPYSQDLPENHLQPSFCTQGAAARHPGVCIAGSEGLKAQVAAWGRERQGLTVTKPFNTISTSDKELKYI